MLHRRVFPGQKQADLFFKGQGTRHTPHESTSWFSTRHSSTRPTETILPVSSDRDVQRSSEYQPFSSFLTDNYSRQHNYLRISVTERCNLRCTYCLPEEGVPLTPDAQTLTTAEIVYLSRLFVKQGVDKIRLTGVEPTVRKGFVRLLRQIGQLRPLGLKELCITTNGISLHRKLDDLFAAGVTCVNLSLDTLDPFQFTLMTKRNGHEAMMRYMNRILAIYRGGEAYIKLKVNCVVMRGVNDREIMQFAELGREDDIEIRFIEYMPFDRNTWSANKIFTFKETLDLTRQRYPGIHRIRDHLNDTSKTYKISGFAGRVGFITSMTEKFCASCSRLRITSDGNLEVCLFGNGEVSLRDILREGNDGRVIDPDAMQAAMSAQDQTQFGDTATNVAPSVEAMLLRLIGMAVKRKEEKHVDLCPLENLENRPMILIGG
jgi:cyclic pyranopterin phosphate synthase